MMVRHGTKGVKLTYIKGRSGVIVGVYSIKIENPQLSAIGSAKTDSTDETATVTTVFSTQVA